MQRIGQSVYSYKGYIVDGYESNQYGWRISDESGEYITTKSSKKDCKDWIDKYK